MQRTGQSCVTHPSVICVWDGPDEPTLTPYSEYFANQIEAAEWVMEMYKNALHQLAK